MVVLCVFGLLAIEIFMSEAKAHTGDARNGRSSGATAVVLLSLLLGSATLATQIATLLITSESVASASVQLANVIQHNDADNISSRSLKLDDILTASTYAPIQVAPSLQDFVGLSPTQIENIERVAITVPHDWECQTRVSGGVHPCPHGIPSPCRYYVRASSWVSNLQPPSYFVPHTETCFRNSHSSYPPFTPISAF